MIGEAHALTSLRRKGFSVGHIWKSDTRDLHSKDLAVDLHFSGPPFLLFNSDIALLSNNSLNARGSIGPTPNPDAPLIQ